MDVTSYTWQPEALAEEAQQEMGARRLSAAYIILLRLVLKLQLSDLYTFQNYWWLAILAIGLLMISCCSKWQE